MKNRVFINLDSDESIFFSKELESVKAKSYDILYPEYKATVLLPVNPEADPGAETIKYEQYDSVGVAKLIASYSDDVPRADVKGKEFRSPVKGLASSFGYSLQEIRAARMANKPLEQRKANAARRAIEIKQNFIGWFGDTATGLPGFINHANISEYTVPADGTGSTKTWSTKTPDQILRDMNGLANSVFTTTKGVHQPDTMILPLDQFALAEVTRVTGINETVMSFFKRTNPFIKNVEWLNELDGAGASSTDRFMVYKKDIDMVSLEIPQPFEMLPVQEKGFEFITNCHQRTGGVIIPYPLSVAFGDGI